MIKCNDWHIGVCTWSLGNNFDKVRTLTDQTQLSHIHFAVSPILNTSDGQSLLKRIRQESWTVTATMINFPQEDYSSLESIKVTGGIVPDQYWDQNRKRVFDAIDITAQLNVKYLSLHFGFLDPADSNSAAKLTDRCKMLADKAAEKNIQLLMETGQETADELRHFLQQLNHPALAVNFDPANMILYDKGSPIEAVQTLAPWIKHIHIKDALRTQTPGTWGLEVPWGTGQVGGTEFLKALKQIEYEGALAIEREAGDDRLGDIKTAVEALIDFAG
ncbi:MAG: sugar phosphate isomerase/epimerase [Planctomycetota bacterium]|nr:MAG: sugar phosphate isomerase/epimerase [Planctomycetota bacterium]